MKKIMIILMLGCLTPIMLPAQTLEGEMTSEWQWSPNKKTVNWMNMLRLDFNYSPWKGGRIEAATLHMAKTNPDESIITDYQVFSNIQEENCYAAIAVLGYWQEFKHARVFAGVRNMNEDYFTSDVASFFTSSSPGIFPTISATYNIANYPVSSLTLHVELEWDAWHVKNSIYNGVGYNGWKRGDNPWIFRPKMDGVFDVLELSYDNEKNFYSVGTTIHDRAFTDVLVDEDGDEDFLPYKKHTSLSWWLYGEQTVWERGDDQKLSLMVQYSENTRSRKHIQEDGGCKRYAEVGCVYDRGPNRLGTSLQYADFAEGREESVEITWSREVKDGLSIQPVFNYIHNNQEKGNYVVFNGRLIYSF